MMYQQEIQFFWPLTEQIKLDLDYKPCEDYSKKLQEERWKNSVTYNNGSLLTAGTGLTNTPVWITMSHDLGTPSFTIDVDQSPITIVSKKKPNFIKQFIYKALGMKWKSK